MARSLDLNVILGTPEKDRNPEWEKAFFESMTESVLTLVDEQPQAGPDGWPYMYASSSPEGAEPAKKVIEWLAARGIGLVINPDKEIPDYVFTYGMIWNFCERGEFLTPMQSNVHGGLIQFKEGEQVYTGPPNTQHLPAYVRAIIREFLRHQGVDAPRVLMISKDRHTYDTCFSLESLGNPVPQEHQGIAEALAWFLPQHYSILLASETGLPDFHDL